MRVLPIVIVLLATPAAAQNPGFVPPDWIKKPSYEDLRAAWPRKAMERGIDGKAILNCTLTTQGLLEACKVMEETPAGMGFGEAALLMTPSFVLKPATQDGKPVQATVNVPIAFEAQGATPAVNLQAMPMIVEPVWDKAPSFADMATAWPAGAKAEFGHVSMRCDITKEGMLRRCRVLTETPRGQGFAKAAHGIVPLFKLRVTPDVAAQVAKSSINLPVRFSNPNVNKDAPRTIVQPKWITRVNPEKVVQVYPDAAIKAGVKTGRGVASCMVAPDGRLTDCKPAAATPEGLGFSEAAVEVAKVMIMNPWSDGGGPVDGVRIKLPVTFNLADDDQALGGSASSYATGVVWTRKPSGDDMARATPAKAIREGVNGRMILDCILANTGRLHDCRVIEESPLGYGFASAALELVPRFGFDPEVAPVGSRVKIPIQIIAAGR